MKRFFKSSLSLILAITIIFSSAYVGLSEVDFGGFGVEVKAADESGYIKYNGGLSSSDVGYIDFTTNKTETSNAGFVYIKHSNRFCLLTVEVSQRYGPDAGEIFDEQWGYIFSLNYYYNYVWLSHIYSGKRYYWVPNNVEDATKGGYWSSVKPSQNCTIILKNKYAREREKMRIFYGEYYVFQCGSETLKSSNISGKNINLYIKDKDNDLLIKNTNVSINGTSFFVDNGFITIDKNSLSTSNTISVHDTYSDFYIHTFNLNYLDDSSETIYLERKKSDNKPYINNVYYKNITGNSNWKNAACENIKILDTSTESFDIAIGATAQTGEIASICLTQDGLHTLESTNGIFSNKQLGQIFEPDKDIIAYCIDNTGNVSPAFKTEIEIENADENVTTVLNDSRIELFSTSGSSFKIGDYVPLLSGAEIGLDFAKLPISVSVDGSKYKVAIGIDNKTFTADEWNLYKKALDGIKDMGLDKSSSDSDVVNDRQRYIKMQEIRKKYGAKVVTGKAVGNGSFDWNILGYVEWEVVKGSPVITSSYIGLSADASYKWQSPYVVLGVPCYTELGVGVTGSVGGSASRITADKNMPIEWDIKLSIEPSLSLGAGLGCPSFLSLGVEGKGSIEWYQEFLNKYRKIDLTLSASVNAKAFLLSYDKEFATKTWNLWSGTYGTTSQSTVSDSADQYYSSNSINLLDSDNYNTLADRDYVADTEWIGGYTPSLFSSRAINVSGYETSLLQRSIYSDSRQQLVEFDGGKMLIWIMDDTTRESANRTELVYSLYDETTATWTEPVAVFDDGTADFLPDVVSDGNNVWVVWQNMNKTFTEDIASMENYSTAAEIYVAKYNGEAGIFEDAIQITDDSIVDSMPAITAENGNISVVWVSNSENDYFGLEGVNSINIASISNGAVRDIETVKTDLTSVSSIDCKLSDGELYIAYAYDMDNDYNNMSDMEIYQLKVSNGNTTEVRITENSVLDSAPCYTELGSEAALVWYSEGDFNILTLASGKSSPVFNENVSATDIYSVAQSKGDITYIIWSQTVGEQVAFYGAVYDGSEWGEPVLLGEASGKVLNPSAVVDADGTMFVAYNNVVQEQVTEIVEDTGEEFTYYTDIQTDLALLKVYQNSNISLNNEGLGIDAESAFPGETIPLTFNVKNSGTTSVDSIDVYINGEFNSTVDISVLPGQDTSVTVDYTVPKTVTETTLSITAEPSGSLDYDLTDNEISVSYGYTELDVSDITVSSTALLNTITAQISNLSAVDSGAFTVEIHENDENGEIVSTKTFDNLAVGESVVLTQDFDKVSQEYDENGISKYYIKVVTDSVEYLTGNNSNLAVFTDGNSSGVTSELLMETTNKDFVHAYGVIQNNEFAEHEIYAKIEVLNQLGEVIGFSFERIALAQKETYTLDKNIYFSKDYFETRLTLLDVDTNDISLEIPEGITSIDNLAFENCSDIVRMIIPDSVTSIGEDVFIGCDSMIVFCNNNTATHIYAVNNRIPFIANNDNTMVDLSKNVIQTNHLNSEIADIMALSSGLTYSINSDASGTGVLVDILKDGLVHSQFTLVVNGDTNGDSICDVLDCAQVERASNNNTDLTGAYAMAADSNSDDVVDITDYQAIVNKALAS